MNNQYVYMRPRPPKRKLTRIQEQHIAWLYETGKRMGNSVSFKRLAQDFGVSVSLVHSIVNNRWRNADADASAHAPPGEKVK